MVIPALQQGGYSYERHVKIGTRPGGRRHFVDYVISKGEGKPILLSIKNQDKAGTAEQKVAYEVISLVKALTDEEGKYDKAYVVLVGVGWVLREFFVGGGLDEYLKDSDALRRIKILLARTLRGTCPRWRSLGPARQRKAIYGIVLLEVQTVSGQSLCTYQWWGRSLSGIER